MGTPKKGPRLRAKQSVPYETVSDGREWEGSPTSESLRVEGYIGFAICEQTDDVFACGPGGFWSQVVDGIEELCRWSAT